jgi:hypothetical protein
MSLVTYTVIPMHYEIYSGILSYIYMCVLFFLQDAVAISSFLQT